MKNKPEKKKKSTVFIPPSQQQPWPKVKYQGHCEPAVPNSNEHDISETQMSVMTEGNLVQGWTDWNSVVRGQGLYDLTKPIFGPNSRILTIVGKHFSHKCLIG